MKTILNAFISDQALFIQIILLITVIMRLSDEQGNVVMKCTAPSLIFYHYNNIIDS